MNRNRVCFMGCLGGGKCSEWTEK